MLVTLCLVNVACFLTDIIVYMSTGEPAALLWAALAGLGILLCYRGMEK